MLALPHCTGDNAKPSVDIFKITGDFTLYRKQNTKTQKDYIECHSNTIIENDIFGKFYLEKDKVYNFNMLTVGQDPILKRNNIWIAKRRIYQLIQNGKIETPESYIKKIMKEM
jgi:hypothetical protein